MKNFYMNWGSDFATSETDIDHFYKKILESGMLMYQYLNHDCQHTEYVLELSHEVNKFMLQHMNYEIAVLRKLAIPELKQHFQHHEYIRRRFDLEMQYDVSDRMRIIMCAKMLKTFFHEHFMEYDMFYLEELRKNFKEPGKLAM